MHEVGRSWSSLSFPSCSCALMLPMNHRSRYFPSSGPPTGDFRLIYPKRPTDWLFHREISLCSSQSLPGPVIFICITSALGGKFREIRTLTSSFRGWMKTASSLFRFPGSGDEKPAWKLGFVITTGLNRRTILVGVGGDTRMGFSRSKSDRMGWFLLPGCAGCIMFQPHFSSVHGVSHPPLVQQGPVLVLLRPSDSFPGKVCRPTRLQKVPAVGNRSTRSPHLMLGE